MTTLDLIPTKAVAATLLLITLALHSSSARELPPATALTPVTVYGGDYRVLPGAASVSVLETESVILGPLATTRDLSALAPNTTIFDGNNNRLPKFSIRGLRENNFVTGDPLVGMYLDDVPFTDLYTRTIPLHDVEEVEFIRGPQGTLYGASGPGGVINLVSRQPDNFWRGRGSVSYGNYDQISVDGGLSGPIVSNQLAFAVSGLWGERDGFVRNTYLGGRPDGQETLSGRVQLRWTPSEPWDISLLAGGYQFNDGFVPTYNPSTDLDLFHVSRDYNGFVDTESWYTALRASYRGDNFKVTSATSYRDWQQDLAQDFDFSAFDPLQAPSAANPLPTIGVFRPEVQQFSQEVRVRSLEDTDRLKWNAGGYFTLGETDTASGRNILVPTGFPPPNDVVTDSSLTFAEQEARTYALFGEATYSLNDRWDFTAGLRLTYDEREIKRRREGVNIINPFEPPGPYTTGVYSENDNFSAVQPKFVIAYHFQPECVMYASVASGYQSGGFNASNDDPTQAEFDPARSWHYELGARALCLDRRLQWNLAFFFTHTDDYQVYRLDQLNPAQAYLLNAERAWSTGAETELAWQATDALTLSLSAGFTHAEFDEFTDTYSGADFAGKKINFVPRFTATVAAEYRFWQNFFARVELVGVGKYYLDEANTAAENGYALLNARVGYQWRNFELSVFGRNLLDEEYVSNALDFRSASTPDLLVRQPGDPLTFGAMLSAKF